MSNFIKHPVLAGFLALVLCSAAIWLGEFALHREFFPERPIETPVKQPVQIVAVDDSGKDSTAKKSVPAIIPHDNQDQIAAILNNSNLDFSKIIAQLFVLLPNLNESEQEEVAQHIANLSDDDQAQQWVAKLIANELPSPATEVLFNDLLNRPNEILTPALATIADLPRHPKKEDSIEML